MTEGWLFACRRPLSRVEGSSTRARKAARGSENALSPGPPLAPLEVDIAAAYAGRRWLQRIA